MECGGLRRLQSAKRGGLRTTLTAGDATGHPMGSRKMGASRRAQTNRLDGRIGAGDHPDRPPAMTRRDASWATRSTPTPPVAVGRAASAFL